MRLFIERVILNALLFPALVWWGMKPLHVFIGIAVGFGLHYIYDNWRAARRRLTGCS